MSLSFSGLVTTAAVNAVVYRGVDPVHPIDALSSAAMTGTAINLPSVTTTEPGDRLLALAGSSGVSGSFSAPANMTQEASTNTVGAADATFDQTVASPGGHDGVDLSLGRCAQGGELGPISHQLPQLTLVGGSNECLGEITAAVVLMEKAL